MAQGIDISEIIDIQTEVQSGGTIRSEFGTGLLVTKNSSISAGGSGKTRRFSSLADVAAVFGDNTNVYRDAAVWFAADPAPKALYIGRWANTRVDSTVEGANIGEGITAPTSAMKISNGTMRVNNTNITINTSSSSTFALLATAVQQQIRTVPDPAASPAANLINATVTWQANPGRLVIDYKSVGDVGAPERSTADGVTDSTDLSLILGFARTPSGYKQGSLQETLTDGLTAMVSSATAGAPTALMMESDSVTGDLNTLETYAQGGDFMSARLSTDTEALGDDDDTSALYNTFNNSRSKIIPVYSRGANPGEAQAPRPDIAILAKLSSQNFDLPLSIITLVPKTLPGTGTTDVTETQLQNLRSKQTSVYTNVGGLPALLGGWTGKSGVFADSQWWILWLKNEMERSIFEAMRSSKRLSHAQLKDTINGVMAKAVNSGGAKPGGVVSDIIKHDIRRVTGNYNFDGIMSTGYVLWIDPPSAQTDTDRAARISRFKIWVAPSEAIHSVGGAIILSSG